MILQSARWLCILFLCLLTNRAAAQGVPTVPAEMQFAGVSVFLTAPSQQRVQQEVQRLYADRSNLRNSIEQMRNMDSVLEPLLEENNVPSDFRYACLPFQPNGGYWGLDATKASLLHLRVDNIVDERLNLASSSEAVLAELTALFPKRTNWVRTLTSFMQGQRSSVTPDNPAVLPNVTKSSIPLGIENPDAIWTVLARKLVYEHESPLIRPTDQYLLYDYRQGRGKSLGAIAAELGVEQTRFVPFNEWLKARLIPTDKTYPVLIRLTPTEYIGVKSQVNAAAQSLQSPTQQNVRRDMGFPVMRRLPVAPSNDPLTRASAIFYEINGKKGIMAQSCDNIITLSYYGRLPIDRFMEINDLNERDLVRPGEMYYLEAKDRRAKVPFHVVQSGQTLREISSMYGVRLSSLLRYNRMEPNQRVQMGRIVWMQQKRPVSQPVEYQKMPDIFPEPEPTLVLKNKTRENEESPIDSPSPPDWKITNPDSAQRSVSMRMGMPSRMTMPTTTSATTRPTPAPRPVADNRPPTTASVATNPTTNAPADADKGFVFHTVKAGDTHSGVAQKYNLKLQDLMTWNNLSYRKPLAVGAQLIVSRPDAADRSPARPDAVSATSKPAPPAIASTNVPELPSSRADDGTLPVVGTSATMTNTPRSPTPPDMVETRPTTDPKRVRGDDDMVIDVERRTPPPPASTATAPASRTLVAANQPTTKTVPPLKPGGTSVIRVQSNGVVNKVQVETPKTTGKEYYHVVQAGQTVYRVALINKVSVPDVMRWNNLPNYTLEVGQRLLIKK